MERDQLKRWLDDGLSLEQIGILLGRDPSTVAYWLKKHGLQANGRTKHAARGEISREELEPLVESGLTLAQIGEVFDRSPSAIRYWLGKHGLSTKARRGPRPIVSRELVREAIENGDRTVRGVCPHHGDGTFVIEGSGRVRCRQCRMDRVSARRRKVKRMLIEEAGGRCVLCGYKNFVGALHFHHLDPAKKGFAVSRNGATLGIATLRAEASKCVVLCANCHAEVEHGATELPVECSGSAVVPSDDGDITVRGGR